MTLEGHIRGIWGARWSRDGTRISTAADDNTTIIYDAVTGRELALLGTQERGSIGDVATPSAGQATEGKVRALGDGHRGDVYDSCWCCNDTILVTTSADKTMKVWSVRGRSSTTTRRRDVPVEARSVVSPAGNSHSHSNSNNSHDDGQVDVLEQQGPEDVKESGLDEGEVDCVDVEDEGEVGEDGGYSLLYTIPLNSALAILSLHCGGRYILGSGFDYGHASLVIDTTTWKVVGRIGSCYLACWDWLSPSPGILTYWGQAIKRIPYQFE